MKPIQPKNRTLFISDNLHVLRRLPDESIDLIATDPPFNAKRVFNAPLGSKAAKQRFDDRWKWDDVTDEWNHLFASNNPAIKEIIEAAAVIEGGKINRDTLDIETGRVKNSIAAFLCWMAPRLVEMHRVLKPTGSLYLHCDPSANSYLRLLLDGIFGRQNFRNEIVWRRMSGTKSSAMRYFSQHDTIFYYTKTKTSTWNSIYEPLSEEEIKASWFRYKDPDGRVYKVGDLGSPGTGGYEYEFLGTTKKWRYNKEKMESLLKNGQIHHKSCTPGAGNSVAVKKRYLDEMPGRPLGSIWTNIQPLNRNNSERTGWSTQKPVKLYERIIKASSNPGDMVLDPFAGCATTCVAAEKLGRQWIGIDIDEVAADVTKTRLDKEVGPDTLFESGKMVTVRKKPVVSANDKNAMRHVLWSNQGGRCGNYYCQIEVAEKNLHLDHRIPDVRGGSDGLENRVGLCGACNSKKGKKAWKVFLDDERAKLPHLGGDVI